MASLSRSFPVSIAAARGPCGACEAQLGIEVSFIRAAYYRLRLPVAPEALQYAQRS